MLSPADAETRTNDSRNAKAVRRCPSLSESFRRASLVRRRGLKPPPSYVRSAGGGGPACTGVLWYSAAAAARCRAAGMSLGELVFYSRALKEAEIR